MGAFWWLSALLLLLAIGFVFYPLWRWRALSAGVSASAEQVNVQAYRSRLAEMQADLAEGRMDEASYQSLKSEMERNLLLDTADQPGPPPEAASKPPARWLPGVLSVLVVVSAAGLYWQLGSSQMLMQMEEYQAQAQAMAHMSPQQRVQVLEGMAQEAPENPEIWYSLAQGYLAMRSLSQADEAYTKLFTLVGEDAALLGEYAQNLFFIAGNRYTQEVSTLVERALAADPNNDTALGLKGIDAFEREDYGAAIRYWQQILQMLPEGRDAQALQAGIQRAQALMDPAGAAEVSSVSPAKGAQIEIELSLSAQLLKETSAEQTVFVYARAVNGPPMPLAAQRLQVQDLPTQVVLNDAMAMTPEFKLSSFEQVAVVARVSKSGSVAPAPGDLEGRVASIPLKETPARVKLVIDNVVE